MPRAWPISFVQHTRVDPAWTHELLSRRRAHDVTSCQERVLVSRTRSWTEAILNRARDPILEDLAIAPGGTPESPRRHSSSPAKGADEVRQIPEADVERDLRDRPAPGAGQQPRRMAHSGADQVLMRRHTEHQREQPQEMKGAEAARPGHASEVERFVRVCIHPESRFHRATAIPCRSLDW